MVEALLDTRAENVPSHLSSILSFPNSLLLCLEGVTKLDFDIGILENVQHMFKLCSFLSFKSIEVASSFPITLSRSETVSLISAGNPSFLEGFESLVSVESRHMLKELVIFASGSI